MTLSVCDLFSEPYGAAGNLGSNFLRLLGAPPLDRLQTVIREAVQNVADAAKLGAGPGILIRLRTLREAERVVLADNVLRDLPQDDVSRERLQAALSRDDLPVLEICDFRTTGLGGPTRSDRIPVGTERTDFIDFIRNIGTPSDTSHGGGTYGFGKVALYRASRCSTILVDTLAHGMGVEGRRLICCHVGRSFDVPDHGVLRRFTGRHWWGTRDPLDGIVDPIVGAAATDLAASLGLPPREGGLTGTSIMILDFDAEDDDLQVSGRRVVEALLWNFWPRMMSEVPRERRFVCRVEVEGVVLPVPKPEEFAPLDLFCKAMRAARNRSGDEVHAIESRRPARLLGSLAVARGLRSPRQPMVAQGSKIPDVVHHIALMRPVELVVKYLEGMPLPDESLEWAGVFLTSDADEVEQAFADSEPPAHDDWIPDSLEKGHSRTFVNVALRELKAHASQIGATPPLRPQGPGSGTPLARLGNRLGTVLEGVGGDGPGPGSDTRRRGGGNPQLPRASQPVFDRLELGLEGRVAVFMTEVTQDRRRSGSTLVASASIAIEGTGARRIDDDVPRPKVISVSSPDGGPAANGPSLLIQGREGRFELRVLIPEDCAVTVDAKVVPDGAG